MNTNAMTRWTVRFPHLLFVAQLIPCCSVCAVLLSCPCCSFVQSCNIVAIFVQYCISDILIQVKISFLDLIEKIVRRLSHPNLIFYSLNWIDSWASDFVNAIRWKYVSERNLSPFSFFWRQMVIRMVFEFEVCVSYFQLFCICGRNNLIVFEAEYQVLFPTKLWYLCFCNFVFLWFCIFEMDDLMAFEAEFRVPPLANHFQT